MALKEAGVRLVTENYNEYVKNLKEISRLNKEAFSASAMQNYQKGVLSARMASANLKKSAESTDQVIKNLRKSFNSAASGAKDLSNSSKSLSSNLTNIKNGMGGALQGVKGLTGGLGGLVGKLGIVVGLLTTAMKIVNFGKASMEVAARNETLRVSLENMGQQFGYTTEQIDIATQQLREQGITTQAAQQSLLTMARANIEWSEASKLARIAQDSAVVAGMNSSEAFERLIRGIQKMEPELLDELGITLRRSDAYAKMAKELGVNEKSLTELQKQQAILNEIYAQSAIVSGSYEAAMGTAGKQQASLARYVEESQNQFGQMLLPIKELSVQLQTTFWKGIQQVTKGLATWGPLIKTFIEQAKAGMAIISELTRVFLGLSDTGSIWEQMGRGAQTWGRIAAETGAIIIATYASVRNTIIELGQEIASITQSFSKGIEAIKSGDFAKADQIFAEMFKNIDSLTDDFTTKFDERFSKNIGIALEKTREKFPDLYKDWDELGKIAVDANKLIRESTEQSVDALSDMEGELAQLKARLDTITKLQDIQENFNKNMEKLHKEHLKAMAEEEKAFLKKQADERKRYQKAVENEEKAFQKNLRDAKKKMERSLADVTRDEKAEEQKIIQEDNQARKQAQRKLHNDLEQERKRFELSQFQATRRFLVQDRRLRAEGDILALMDLREDFALQQAEAKEGFDLQQGERVNSVAEEQRQRQEETQQKLAQLRIESAAKRDEIKRSYKEEIADAQEAHAERMAELSAQHEENMERIREEHQEKIAELKAQYKERKQELIDARQEEIKELGKSLQEEGEITKEGMEAIAEEISKVFGDEGAGAALIEGWTERSEDSVSQLVDNIKAQIEELEAAMKDGTQSIKDFQDQASAPPPSTQGPTSDPTQRQMNLIPQPMRQGGVGVVTGPAAFSVEPGQREAVMFAPLPAMGGGRSQIDVNMQGGFNITGAEIAGKAAVEMALEKMTDEFSIAVRNISRRGGR